MGIPKRMTDTRWIISRIDTALAFVDDEKLKKYWGSFDIEHLGTFDPKDEPAKIKVKPLSTRFASLDKGLGNNTSDDHWAIFALHVEEIDSNDFKLEFEGSGNTRSLTESSRQQFPENFIADVSDMICQMANADGNKVPFALRLSFVSTMKHYRLNLVK
jgi:hypothetical protein